MHDETLSLVVPCFNEEECLPYFYDEVTSTLDELVESVDENLRFELIFVDDGSSDRTLEVVKQMPADPPAHPRLAGRLAIRWVSFSRNFGKEAAIYAGLEASRGAYTTILDADLQDPPSLLIEMFCTLQRENADSVAARRVNRDGEPPIRSFFARQFYKIIQKISTADIVDGARDYRLMRRPVVDAILSLREYNRFSKGIFGWVGFKNVWVPTSTRTAPPARPSGASSRCCSTRSTASWPSPPPRYRSPRSPASSCASPRCSRCS